MASNYYRNLYYGQVENNQILSKDYMNLKHENKQLKEKIDKAIEILHAMKHCELLLGDNKKSNVKELLEILGDKE